MAVQGPIPVEFGVVFPSGAYAAGAFEPVRNFDASTGEKFVQSSDKTSGMPLWAATRGRTRLVSTLIGGSGNAENVTPGQCSRSVPALACAAGNGWVRSPGESPRATVPSSGHR